MKRLANIYSLVFLSVLTLTVACNKPPGAADEKPAAGVDDQGRGFDPLELPADKQILPQMRPQNGVVATPNGSAATTPEAGPADSTAVVAEIPEAVDTVNSQAYRVQIATTKLYGEAQKAVAIAEEIFDRPIFVDYEVPYFKVRVGNFDTRDDADAYSLKAKAAGYTNAWVVMVTLNTKEPGSLYPNLPEGKLPLDSTKTDSLNQNYGDDAADSN